MLIARLRFPAEVPNARQQAFTRFETVQAALDRISEVSLAPKGVDAGAIERARELYAQRATQLAGECRDGVPDAESDTAGWLRLRLELLGVERTRLQEMRDEGVITTPLLLAVQEDLDLEISRLQRRMEAR